MDTRTVTKPRKWAGQAGERRLPGISSLPTRADMVRCGHSQTGSITCLDHARRGSCRSASSRAGCVRSGSPDVLGFGEATDLAVAQAVIDQGEKLAGPRPPGALVAPTGRDLSVVIFDLGCSLGVGDRLDRGPAHQSRSLLGDVAPLDLDVGLFVPGCQS